MVKKPTSSKPIASKAQQTLTEALRLFGFQIGDEQGGSNKFRTFAIPQNYDGAVTIQAGGVYGTYVDLEGIAKNEIELITRYREMSLQPECENAIEDVVNEAIVVEEQEAPVKINLDRLSEETDYSEDFKQKIIKEFGRVLKILNFNKEGHDIFKRWYVDGRLFYHIMIDEEKVRDGIQEVRYIDPRRIRKVREVKKRLDNNGTEVIDFEKEYFIYNERGINNTQSTAVQGVKIAVDSICYVTSGLIDSTRNQVLSYLHQAIKPINQLRMMEDALVIYRLSRAPERRLFYIDIGNLPKLKAEEYMKGLMNRYRNKIIYDANTGEVRDDKKFLSLMEDYWLPRREGTKGTEVDTLEGGQNLGEITDVNFFQEKLYRALKVPVSRLKSEGGFNLGKSSEISRDEIKFTKFVTRIRHNFEELFNSLLYTQLILKGIIVREDWEEIKDCIFYSFLKDSYYAELKEIEILQSRMEILEQVHQHVGVYFSQREVHKKILKRTDEEIDEVMAQIKKEKVLIPDAMEAEVKVQKDMMNAQGEMQLDQMDKQAKIQGQQQKQQIKLQTAAEQDSAGAQIQTLKAQQDLEQTRMAHSHVKIALNKSTPKQTASSAKPKAKPVAKKK
jgi:hypothetical protein